MSNPLVKMRELQAMMKAFEEEIQTLQANPQLKAELLFESELGDLLARHGKTIHEAVQTVDPSFYITTTPPRKTYKPRGGADGDGGPRKSKTKPGAHTVWYDFTNPHTGESVRSANILKAKVQEWIQQYGKDVVLTWRKLAPAE